MTNVFDHSAIPYKHVLDAHLETAIDSAILRSDAAITAATTIKAAWALVLAEMAGANDVVFGSVVSGLDASFADVEYVAGACIDNIPVRVTFTPGMTWLDLLQRVQKQYFEATDYE